MRIVNTETDIKYNLSIRPLITILLRVPILLILPTRFKKTRNFKKPRDFENHKSSKFEHFRQFMPNFIIAKLYIQPSQDTGP